MAPLVGGSEVEVVDEVLLLEVDVAVEAVLVDVLVVDVDVEVTEVLVVEVDVEVVLVVVDVVDVLVVLGPVAPGNVWNRSARSVAVAARRISGVTPRISCTVRSVDACEYAIVFEYPGLASLETRMQPIGLSSPCVFPSSQRMSSTPSR